jgi:hypothetical protein
MSRMLPKKLTDELDRLPVPWELEHGTKHARVRAAGRVVMVVSHGRQYEQGRELQNNIASVRRFARGLQA